MKWSSQDYLIAFNMVRGIGLKRLRALEQAFGTLEQAWNASSKQLASVPGFGPQLIAKFLAQKQTICPIREQELAAKQGISIITILDQGYPENLRHIHQPPPVLYYRGKLPYELGIAIVGTRKASASGKHQAFKFAQALAEYRWIISGLAVGIDTHAHQGALAAQGFTLGVLGTSLMNIYPRSNRYLADKIAETGCLISEFSFKSPATPGNFLQRNRLISALSLGVLVVEAGAKSGALNTVSWALNQGKDVWAIPGEIHHLGRQGNHQLIKEGASLVASPEDIIEELGLDSCTPGDEKTPEINWEIKNWLIKGYTPEQLVASGFCVKQVQQMVTELQLQSLLK